MWPKWINKSPHNTLPCLWFSLATCKDLTWCIFCASLICYKSNFYSSGGYTPLRSFLLLIWLCCIWVLWNERNHRLFYNNAKSVMQLLEKVKTFCGWKLKMCAFLLVNICGGNNPLFVWGLTNSYFLFICSSGLVVVALFCFYRHSLCSGAEFFCRYIFFWFVQKEKTKNNCPYWTSSVSYFPRFIIYCK